MWRWLGVLVLCASCSVLKRSSTRDDWSRDDHSVIKRVAVLVAPYPAGDATGGAVMARIARRYVNQKRKFLVKAELASQAPPSSHACGGEEGIEGLLWLKPVARPIGGGFELEVQGSLLRCPDLREAWSGFAAGSFASKDEGLAQVTKVYEQELGAEAAPFVAPALHVLRPLLDSLPEPTLTEADIEEKLGLD